jgi:glycosyl-4,4'-diaponeurosporenoate acyltransferase
MSRWVWMANLFGWPVIQLGFAYWVQRRPVLSYENDSWLTRERPWETGSGLYRRAFLVDRWKNFLPSGALWLRSAPDRRLTISNRRDCRRFLAETRRAEHAHWYMLFCTPVFFLWNPVWACLVMSVYGVLTNMPCILAQRFNRLRVQRTLARK